VQILHEQPPVNLGWVVLVVRGVVVSAGLLGVLSPIPLAGSLMGSAWLKVAVIPVAIGIVLLSYLSP